MPLSRPVISTLQYSVANLLIVAICVLLFLEGMPWMPGRALALIAPVTNSCGIWTGPWNMFAPEPDITNHRIRAEIEYYDGTKANWRSPEWPEMSNWSRFCSSRHLEFCDAIAYENDTRIWTAFANYLAREQRQNWSHAGRPKEVKFIVEESIIPKPLPDDWPLMSETFLRDNEWVAFRVKFP